MAETIAAPPGWYFVRVEGGPGHVNGLKRYPVAAWRDGEPLLAKPGRAGLTPPTEDDTLACVGLCPPDREWQSMFSQDEVLAAAQRLAGRGFRADQARVYQADQAPADTSHQAVDPRRKTALYEVEAPGLGPVPVRDERPQAQVEQQQQGDDHWTKKVLRNWRDSAHGPARLPGS